MNNPKDYRSGARVLLSAHPAHKRVVAIYTAVYLALGLLLAVSTLVTENLINRTGGLGDMSLRTLILTVDQFIALAVQIFTPLWTLGAVSFAMGIVRNQPPTPGMLLGGARRWAVLLRYGLCLLAVYFAAGYALLMIALPLYMNMPQGQALAELAEPFMTAPALTDEMVLQLMEAMMPLYAIVGIGLAVVILAMRYLFGMAIYRLLDQDRPGAIRAMTESVRLLKGHRLELLKLDISWLWYSILSYLASCILSVPSILTTMGVALPVDYPTAYLLCYLVFIPVLGTLYMTTLARRETTYALFYNNLLPEEADSIR